jgi:hypothetical protein
MFGRKGNLLIPVAVVCLCLSLFLTRVDLGNGRVWVFFEGLLLGFAFALSVFRLITLAMTDSYD